jgi:phosphatidylserine decarboxylase
MLSVVAVRQVYIIRVNDSSSKHRYVVVIEIGMGEVSSCQSTVVEGQEVKRGDQLGYFAFGGSSYAMIFDKDFDLEFKKGTFDVDSEGKPKMQLVNSLLATYK